MTENQSVAARPLFLDTTIHVGLMLEDEPRRAEGLRSLKASSSNRFSCTFGRLEYKRVVLQNLALSLDYLCETGSFSGAIDKARRLRRQRRHDTLIQVLAWTLRRAGATTIETPTDATLEAILTEKGISILRNAIRSAWKRFSNNVHELVDAMSCQRAKEMPREKANGSWDLTVHRQQCQNRGCDNANFFRANLPVLRRLAAEIRRLPRDRQTDELTEIAQAIEQAANNPERLYDYNRCLKMGDAWLHLECVRAGVKDFATTNYRESQVLCPQLGLEMQIPTGHPSAAVPETAGG